MPHPNDPKLRSFIPVDPTSDFPIQNLPYGVFSAKDGLAPRVGVAIGDYVLDLWQLAQDCRIDVVEPGVFAAPSLNPFMALGPKVWSQTRARISELLRHDHPELRDNEKLRKRTLVPMADVKLHHADRGRRLHRFLFLEGARHQCRRHVPRQGQRAAAELAAYADRLQRPRIDRRGQRHPSPPATRAVEAANGGASELRPVQAARFRTGNGRRDRAGLRDGRDADRDDKRKR